MLGLGAADSQGHLMGTPVLAVVVGTHFCIPIPGPWGARCCLYAGRGFCRQSLHTSPTPFPPTPHRRCFPLTGNIKALFSLFSCQPATLRCLQGARSHGAWL